MKTDFVRDPVENKIECCWSDCDRWGHLAYRWRWDQGGPIYLFCSERHREFYVHSHRQLNHLPTGSKGLPAPR